MSWINEQGIFYDTWDEKCTEKCAMMHRKICNELESDG